MTLMKLLCLLIGHRYDGRQDCLPKGSWSSYCTRCLHGFWVENRHPDTAPYRELMEGKEARIRFEEELRVEAKKQERGNG